MSWKATVVITLWNCNASKYYIAAAKLLQSCPALCDPIDSSPPGSTIPGILQARTLKWVAISLLQCIKVKNESEVTQFCPTLRDPMDCSLPGSSIHGIFLARVLEWGAIAFSENIVLRGCKRKQHTCDSLFLRLICRSVHDIGLRPLVSQSPLVYYSLT